MGVPHGFATGVHGNRWQCATGRSGAARGAAWDRGGGGGGGGRPRANLLSGVLQRLLLARDYMLSNECMRYRHALMTRFRNALSLVSAAAWACSAVHRRTAPLVVPPVLRFFSSGFW